MTYAKDDTKEIAEKIIQASELIGSNDFSLIATVVGADPDPENFKDFYRKYAREYHSDIAKRKNPDATEDELALLDQAFKALCKINDEANRELEKIKEQRMRDEIAGEAKMAFDLLEDSYRELDQIQRDLNRSDDPEARAIAPLVGAYKSEILKAQNDIVRNQAPEAVAKRLKQLNTDVQEMYRDEPPGFKNHGVIRRAFSNFFKRISIGITKITNPEKGAQMERDFQSKQLLHARRETVKTGVEVIAKEVEEPEERKSKKRKKGSSK